MRLDECQIANGLIEHGVMQKSLAAFGNHSRGWHVIPGE
jgi:hypothetical protein